MTPRKVAIGPKNVFQIKYTVDGSVEHYKDKIVNKGFTQQEGVDYLDTFSLVAKMTYVPAVLTLATPNNWFSHQLVVNNTIFAWGVK